MGLKVAYKVLMGADRPHIRRCTLLQSESDYQIWARQLLR